MRRVMLFLRGAIPLALVAVTLIALPALVAWWLSGGPFGWQHLLLGLLGGAALLLIMGLILGWAVGRMRK